MQWFETAARILLIAGAVLVGATVVRNVTEALTVAVKLESPHPPDHL